MRTRRTKEQIRKDNYNRDVDAYNFYVVNLDTMRAETGFEFKEDAVDLLNDYDDKKKYKVVSKRALKSMGIENPNESFKYEGGGDLESIASTYGKMLNDLSKEKQFNKKMEKNAIINRYAKQHDITIDNNNIIYIKGERIAYIDKINQKTGQSKSNWEIKKFEFGGDFQSGVYAKGGGLESHGIKQGDTFLKTISGGIQQVKDKNGNIFYINLATGERSADIPLPFANGGEIRRFDRHAQMNSDTRSEIIYVIQDLEIRNPLTNYLYGLFDGYDYSKTKNFKIQMNKLRAKDFSLHKRIKEIYSKIDKYKFEKYNDFDEGGEVTYFINKDGIRVRSKVEPKEKLSEKEWMAKHNESKEARSYAFGGFFGKSDMESKPKKINLNDKQVRLNSGEYVQVLDQDGDTLMVMELSKIGTGASPKMVKISDVDMTSFATGGSVDVKKGAIKVGVFSLEDLKTDVFEKAFNKKSKETGFTNIDLKTINRGGKTFIEFYLIPDKTDSDVKIKDWYMKNYPTDDLGEELNDEVTFEDMWNEDYKKYDIYQVMGVGDSLIRERLFEHLAEIKGVSYDVVYKKLFSTDGFYATGGGVTLNTEVILSENRPNGAVWQGVVKPFMLESIEKNQYAGGFKRYEIDIYDEVKREPTKEEIKQANEFFDKIGGRYAFGGGVEKISFEDWLKKNNIEVYKRTYYWVADDGGSDYMYSGSKGDVMKSLREDYKKSFANGGGVGLIGNQKRIDMNHNGKIDAEDFEIMRNTMDGAWRKERKYVNSTSRKNGKVIDYEVRYARKNNPSRKGYKGKTFANGGFLKMLDGKLYERVKFSNGIEDWYEADLLHKVNFYCSQNGLNPNNQKDFEKALENVSKTNFATGGRVNKDIEINPTIKNFIDKLKKEGKYNKGNEQKNVNGVLYRFDEYKLMNPSSFMVNEFKKLVEKNYGVLSLSNGYDSKTINLKGNKVIYANLSNNKGGYTDYITFRELVILNKTGGAFEKLSNRVARNYEGKRVKPQYQKEYGKVYSKEEAKEVGDKVAGKVKANQKMATGGETKKGGQGAIMILAKKIRKDGEKWTDAVKRAGQQLK